MAASRNDGACVIRFSRFTSDTGPLTKTLSLSADGCLVKDTTANLSVGNVENLSLICGRMRTVDAGTSYVELWQPSTSLRGALRRRPTRRSR